MNRVFSRSAEVAGVKLDLFKRFNISVQFKTRFYRSVVKDKVTEYVYHHAEYLYNSNNKPMVSINLSPDAYITFTTSDIDKEKHGFIMTQSERSSFIRRNFRLVDVLERYNNDEISGLVKNGVFNQELLNYLIPNDTLANPSKFSQLKNTVTNGDMSLVTTAVLVGDGKISVEFCINGKKPVALVSRDFCNLYHTLKDINYTDVMLHMLNYVGRPEPGEFRKDLRKDIPGMQFDDSSSTDYLVRASANGDKPPARSNVDKHKNNW